MTSPLWWDSGLVFLAHRFQLQCGIPKASGKRSFQHSHSNHRMTLFLSSSPLFNWSFFSPMLLLDSGLGRCPTLVGPFCEGTRSRGKMMRWWWWWGGREEGLQEAHPLVPPAHSPSNPTVHNSATALFPVQDIPTHFSQAENPSHEWSARRKQLNMGSLL